MAAFSFILCSCNGYLDVKPKGKIIPKTTEDYSTIIHYWLDQIEKGSDEVIVPDAEKTDHLELFADDLDATLASSFFSTYLYVGSNINNNSDDYETLYSVIKDCNMIIGNLDDVTSDMGKNIMGTAWSIRSVCYYNLMRMYCDAYNPETADATLGLPLVDKFDMEAKPARASLKETAKFIENGFKKALSYEITNNDYLFTADVTKAYFARFYFWIQDWDNTIITSEGLLEKYPLLESDEYVDAMNQKLTKTHNVIMRSYTTENDLGMMSFASAKSDVQARPLCKDLVDLFNEDANDIRKSYSFDKKRIATKMLTTKFRSEEICLMLAEAYAHKSDNTKAFEYLNLLRSKRISSDFVNYTTDNLPPVFKQTITVDAQGKELTPLISAILCERRKELFLEGDRWFELKRNGCPEIWIAANGKKYITKKYMYTFPIPIEDTRLFPGLIIQNPGYEQ